MGEALTSTFLTKMFMKVIEQMEMLSNDRLYNIGSEVSGFTAR